MQTAGKLAFTRHRCAVCSGPPLSRPHLPAGALVRGAVSIGKVVKCVSCSRSDHTVPEQVLMVLPYLCHAVIRRVLWHVLRVRVALREGEPGRTQGWVTPRQHQVASPRCVVQLPLCCVCASTVSAPRRTCMGRAANRPPGHDVQCADAADQISAQACHSL